jgi:hypothetical protein
LPPVAVVVLVSDAVRVDVLVPAFRFPVSRIVVSECADAVAVNEPRASVPRAGVVLSALAV